MRGEHGGLTYRVNGVLLPEGLNGFGQDLDTPIIQSVDLLTGTLPAQFGFRTVLWKVSCVWPDYRGPYRISAR